MCWSVCVHARLDRRAPERAARSQAEINQQRRPPPKPRALRPAQGLDLDPISQARGPGETHLETWQKTPEAQTIGTHTIELYKSSRRATRAAGGHSVAASRQPVQTMAGMTDAEATRLAEEEGLSLILAPGTSRAEVQSLQTAVVVACPACPPSNRHVAHTCGRGMKRTATNTKTGYRGVSYDSDSKFSAHIRQGGTKRHIGSFSSAAEAALAYARAAATAPAAQLVAVSEAEADAEPEAPLQPLQPHALGKRVPKRKRVFESLESADPPEAPQLPLRQRESGPPRPLRCTIETPCAACSGSANKATV